VAESEEGAGADGIIDMAKFLKLKGMDSRCTGAVIPTAMPSGSPYYHRFFCAYTFLTGLYGSVESVDFVTPSR
jgi:hypothetical protein